MQRNVIAFQRKYVVAVLKGNFAEEVKQLAKVVEAPKPVKSPSSVEAPRPAGGSSFFQRLGSFLAGLGIGFGASFYYIYEELEASNRRLENEIRQMMEEMDDINWQAEIKQIVEKTIRERKKQRILARAKERWKDQIPNERGAVEMIREDRDAP